MRCPMHEPPRPLCESFLRRGVATGQGVQKEGQGVRVEEVQSCVHSSRVQLPLDFGGLISSCAHVEPRVFNY